MSIDESDILTGAEAADLLKLHQRTIYKLAKANLIPSGRIGRSWRFSRQRLLEFLSESQAPKAQE